ncbi:AraC family transcriptional regulator [Lacrimispora sp.]|jgi:AraC-like DNA-binding protein|uniref:AraC family transcriptional regulator n=1 Tax=Lacrimispora sp. TaxID=2719234 RepID=UPI0028B18FE3|nr:AraC family transcriptional regulator [Lacrimispora sp.]
MDLDFNNMIPELHYYIHRKCTVNWKIEAGITPFIDVTYVIKGKAKYMIGDKEYTVKKGDLLCIPKKTYRAATNIPEDLMECYVVNFFLSDLKGQDVSLPFPIISHIGIIPRLITLFHDIHGEWMQRDFGYMLKVRANMCLILYQASNLLLNEKRISQDDPRIKNSIQFMSCHYSEPALTIDKLAKQFDLHPVYYGSLFQQTTGMTFKQYLTSLRLNYAESMLKSGEYGVSEVALQCGFSDIFYFSRLFKQKKGIPPSELFPEKRRGLELDEG